MTNKVQFIAVGLIADDKTPVDKNILDESIFLKTCFIIDFFRVQNELVSSLRKHESLGVLWSDLLPEEGEYTFEIATELPFFLPNLENKPEYTIDIGNERLFICNRMVRAFIGSGLIASPGYVTSSGFSSSSGIIYYLAHRMVLPELKESERSKEGLHPIPMKTFVSMRFKVKADNAEPVIEENFYTWRDKLLSLVSELIKGFQVVAPQKTKNMLPHSSAGGYPIFWLAGKGAGNKRGCVQFASHPQSTAPQTLEKLEEKETEILISQLKSLKPSYSRQALGLAYAFHFYGYYELAIVQTCIASEIILSFVYKRYLQKHGVSKSKIKESIQDIFLSQLLNLHLPCICDITQMTNHSNVIGDINWARKRRNEIIHEGVSQEPLEKDRVAEVITSANSLIDYLETVSL